MDYWLIILPNCSQWSADIYGVWRLCGFGNDILHIICERTNTHPNQFTGPMTANRLENIANWILLNWMSALTLRVPNYCWPPSQSILVSQRLKIREEVHIWLNQNPHKSQHTTLWKCAHVANSNWIQFPILTCTFKRWNLNNPFAMCRRKTLTLAWTTHKLYRVHIIVSEKFRVCVPPSKHNLRTHRKPNTSSYFGAVFEQWLWCET